MQLLSSPRIERARLWLRPCRVEDVEQFQRLTDDPAITDAVDFLSSPFTRAAAEALIVGQGDGRDCFWGVWPQGNAEMIGVVGTHLRGSDEIEIGYWFTPKTHGRGFASEAVAAIIEILRTAYPERRIFAECRPENEASWRLLERAGFLPDGKDGLRLARKRLIFSAGRQTGGSRPLSG